MYIQLNDTKANIILRELNFNMKIKKLINFEIFCLLSIV